MREKAVKCPIHMKAMEGAKVPADRSFLCFVHDV
jgi:hypothetical protein